MPVGPYPTFKACVSAQRKKGKSEEAARKICGHIEKLTKQSEHNTKGAATPQKRKHYT